MDGRATWYSEPRGPPLCTNRRKDQIMSENPTNTLESVKGFWETLSQYSRNRLGGFDEPVTSDALEALLKHAPADPVRFARELAPGTEYQLDGAKTTIIMAAELSSRLVEHLGGVEQSQLRGLRQNLSDAVEAVQDPLSRMHAG